MLIASLIRDIKEILLYAREKRRLRILRQHGMQIGRNVTIMPGTDFDFPYSHLITIGNNCSISRDVRIMAHDATVNKYLGYTIVKPVTIHDNCFIGERVLILPGAEIGPDAVVAAGSVVNKRIPQGKIAAGTPARIYDNIENFLSKVASDIQNAEALNFDEFFTSANFKNVKKILDKNGLVAIRRTKRPSLTYGGSPELISHPFYNNIREKLNLGVDRKKHR